MKIPRSLIRAALAFGVLGACAPDPADTGTGVSRQQQKAPPGAAPGTCWGRYTSPAVIETVTHQVLIRPAETDADGTVTSPAVYRTETSQDIVRPRSYTWFQTPCEADLTEEFVASVQRALAVRGLYQGEITGEMDMATRKAVRRYQKPLGLDSAILSLDTARRLGLITVDLEAAG